MKRSGLAFGLLFAACTRAPASTPPEAASAMSAHPAPAQPAPSASATASDAPPIRAEPTAPPPELSAGGPKTIRGEHGLVVAVEARAAGAAVHVLERGGNAVDAAVALGFALAVTHPSAGNVGGGGFMLVRPKGGPTVAIDFRETAPKKLPRDAFDRMIAADGIGAMSVGVPGTVAGLVLAHEKFGRLPFRELLQPAVDLAKKGHRVGHREAQTLAWSWSALKKNAAARAEFAEGDRPKKENELLVRADLAKTLERIRDHGADGFYRGETAERIVRAVSKAGGTLTLDDLSGYEAKIRQPLVFHYRGLTLETMPPPSAGGVALLEMLGISSRLQIWKAPADSATELHEFLEASRRAEVDKRFEVIDPDAESASEREQKLGKWQNIAALLERHPIDPERATPSSDLSPLYAAAVRELEHTTHFSVVDADGMAVSCTTTLSAGFGSKLVAAGTGVVLNDSVASFSTVGENLPVGGRRTTSSMAPTLVTRDQTLVLVLGTPGGNTIPSTIAQVFRNLVDHGMTLDRAVDAPRLYQGLAPDEVRYERAHAPEKSLLEALRKMGHTLSKKTIPMGDANDILIAGGVAYGYADPREGGVALAAKAQDK